MSEISFQTISNTLNSLSTDNLISLNKNLVNIIKQRRKVKYSIDLNKFKIGDKVSFRDSRQNLLRNCVITKINRITISLTELPTSSVPGKQWRAPGSMLTKI